MKLAFDVQYFDDYAKSVAISFESWQDSEPQQLIEKKVIEIADYVPGEFFKRELPCILSIVNDLNIDDIELIVIDGYVHLDDEGKFGLGGHLYKSLEEKIPVIGVAKTSFKKNVHNMMELLRGESEKPLFITSIGIDINQAREYIATMHGKFRMPTLLQILDTATKTKSDWQ